MKINRKKLITITFILVLLLLSLFWMRWRPARRFESSLPGENEFRIATWNVGYFSAVKNKNVRDVDLNTITEIIRTLNADVIILQELGSMEHPKKILQGLGKEWSEYSVETGHGTQVLSIITKSRISSSEEFICGGRKIMTLSLMSRNGKSIYIAGVHSPHPARGKNNTVENIRCALSHAINRSEQVRIVAGDLNYNFDPQDKDGLLYQEIMESFGDSTIGLGETYYAHTRIDHVFHYPKNLRLVEKRSGLVDLSPRFAKVPGFRDHRPIVVTYDLGGI